MKHDFKVQQRIVSFADKTYKLDPARIPDCPRFAADFVQVTSGGDFFTITFGSRRDSFGLETDLVDPVAIVSMNPAMLDKMLEILTVNVANRKAQAEKEARNV